MRYIGRVIGVLFVLANSLIWINHQGIFHQSPEIGLFEIGFSLFYIVLGWWLGKIYDISKLQKREILKSHMELEYLTNRDGLTGISNRRSFDNYLLHEWEKAGQSAAPISLILFDIDYFKEYNDTYGHLSGDDCLKEIATTVDRVIEIPGNMVARYGGEEFAVIIPETTLNNAYEVAEEIRFAIETLKTKRVVTASVGVTSIVPKASLSIADFIPCADYGLYQSKHQGRNKVPVYPFNELLSIEKAVISS
ncbi:GGDEF domain-containing protein [Bacillus sp. ISL-75]|uniref:GGDEF domain-containing protein n=1 Tax=Bacillus sp. ISL-75 TaxID=2819137 RepID=UPI001BED26F9|nr:GGDEF domain-containing protein [Bacillus sp. ISL-75]MBT2727408.1 GGDEF domain-containing protein [Bacillus sp. ISL-75]